MLRSEEQVFTSTLLSFVGRPYRTPLMSYRWMCLLSCGIAISPWVCDTDNLPSHKFIRWTSVWASE